MMKKSVIVHILSVFYLLTLTIYLSGQEQKHVAIESKPESRTSQQLWSMELRAGGGTIQSFINDWYEVNSTLNKTCSFTLTYDHGQNYYSSSGVTYTFNYYLYKNGVQIDHEYDQIYGLYVEEYTASKSFSPSVLVSDNDVIRGRMEINFIETTYPYTLTQVLPLNYSENTIEFVFNPKNVIIDNIFEPTCPEVSITTYYDVVQASNSITLDPGFIMDSEVFDNFTAEIITSKNKYNKAKSFGFIDPFIINNGSENSEFDRYINVYPNPSDGVFYLKNISNEDVQFKIYNNYGLVQETTTLVKDGDIRIDLMHLKDKYITVILNTQKEVIGRKTLIIN